MAADKVLKYKFLPVVSVDRILSGFYNQVKRYSPGSPRDWQWYLKDTAVSMNVESAWRAGYTGKGVLVAVVDDGVNMNHPDLEPNFNVTLSYDFLKDRNISKLYSPGSHGTNCAGIIAGGDNNDCGVGIAFDAQIASIRLYDDNIRSTDQSEARALSYKKELVDIYSNSWGPGDMGWQVEGPGPRLTEALKNGTRSGRRGKGSIFVFAAGNGGITGDSCAFSGYVNNIHTIAISGVNWDGSIPGHTEKCAAIMAVTLWTGYVYIW
ncbi:Proprotein convertase subtilisin kexin type [Desmophyllum pertusum]|uniref:Proprotein convertase subtilisin kexin type n=1 Tax=Desmophyllum pertusum TaxID=174260 RepID=A0A9W9YPP5_9CNID|nr:Proprotein convertase subtilisin kexin type [Desmophyllum pertusum]